MLLSNQPDSVDVVSDPDSGSAPGDFFEHVYDELHGLAARQMRAQGAGHTLQATALVSELYLKMGHYELDRWESRAHFIAMAARAMRSILVDHARSTWLRPNTASARATSWLSTRLCRNLPTMTRGWSSWSKCAFLATARWKNVPSSPAVRCAALNAIGVLPRIG
jgi:hypothetical protein